MCAFWHVQRATCSLLVKNNRIRLSPLYINAATCGRAAQSRTFLSSIFKRVDIEAPCYPTQPYLIKLGSIDVVDEFRWLCDYEAAKPYLQQEQQYYDTASRRWSQQAQQLLQEMRQHVSRVQQEDPPEQVGPFLYYTASNPHGQDTVMRQGAAGSGQAEVVVSAEVMKQDAEVLAGQYAVHVLGETLMALKLSQDQQLLAYSVDVAEGSEETCCIAKDLTTGRLLADCVLPNVTSFEWSAGGSCLYYCRPDDLGRPSKVYRHVLGQHQGSDVLLFSEEDPKHFVTLTRTKDWRYVLINTHSKLSSEVHLLDAHDALATPICLQPRTPGLEYFVEHHHGHLMLLTNRPPPTAIQPGGESHAAAAPGGATPASTAAAPNGVPGAAGPATEAAATAAAGDAHLYPAGDYCLATVPAAEAEAGRGGIEGWRLLVPERPGVAVTDMDVFDSCAVLHELHGGRPGLNIITLAQEQHQQQNGMQLPHLVTVVQQQQVVMPDWVFALRPGINQDYHSSSMRLYASSPAAPEQALQLNLSTGQLQQYQPQQQHKQVAGRSQPQHAQPAAANMPQHSSQQHLVCQQLWAPAADGSKVPVTLLHQQGQLYNGLQPLLVEVYGAYGQVLQADYRAHRRALLQRGWSVALAHVRGGGELGRRWHAAGRQLQKPNSVSDLLACLQLLVDMQVTSRGRIAGQAASAGGLTMAAAVNAAPDWFSCVVLEVPFVDWVGGMIDVALNHLLTEHEIEEWGDPQQPAVADMISSMCPYSNVSDRLQYPPMLVTAGLLDTRVPFWMPVKYVAKLRNAALQSKAADGPGRGLVLLQFAEDAGHFSMGESGGSLEDVAAQYAFMLYCNQIATQWSKLSE